MDKLQLKLERLKWLQHIGIEYYCSVQKDSKKSCLINLQESYKQKIQNRTSKTLPTIDKIIKQKMPTKKTINSINISESQQLANKATSLLELKQMVENFDGCSLKKFAQNTVFCDGNPNANILLIGEAPGATEDEKGIPFCGESGQLLDKMLATINLDRKKNIYITNTIFWRPPANRRPTPEEIAVCKPFVEKHIALVNPKLIILIGGTATSSLLNKKGTISEIRKNYYSYTNQYLNKNIDTAALYHPAFLLRSPYKKKDTWFDLLRIREYIKKEGII